MSERSFVGIVPSRRAKASLAGKNSLKSVGAVNFRCRGFFSIPTKNSVEFLAARADKVHDGNFYNHQPGETNMNGNETRESLLLDSREVGELLGICAKSVERLARNGRFLRGQKLGRLRKWSRESVLRWVSKMDNDADAVPAQ